MSLLWNWGSRNLLRRCMPYASSTTLAEFPKMSTLSSSPSSIISLSSLSPTPSLSSYHLLTPMRFKGGVKTNSGCKKRFRVRGSGSIKRWVFSVLLLSRYGAVNRWLETDPTRRRIWFQPLVLFQMNHLRSTFATSFSFSISSPFSNSIILHQRSIGFCCISFLQRESWEKPQHWLPKTTKRQSPGSFHRSRGQKDGTAGSQTVGCLLMDNKCQVRSNKGGAESIHGYDRLKYIQVI